MTNARIEDVRSVDPGDETERNYRYQHQYGVVLLVAVIRGAHSYTSLYCEHHEDFLCERTDGLFDGYQIKTSTPENGPWTLTSAALVRSLGRFVDLVTGYSGQIGDFFFVSNSDIDTVAADSLNQAKRSRCPGLMVEHLRACATIAEIEAPFTAAFDALTATLACDPQSLFDVLKRLQIVKGPSRGEFDASLAHEHLGGLPQCAAMTPAQLTDLRDDLVARFHRAASVHVTDPERHIRGLFSGAADPYIASKRIVCAEVVIEAPGVAIKAFAYQGQPTLNVGGTRPDGVLEQKLEAGGLNDTVEYLKARETAAEYYFLEEQAKNPETASRSLLQVEQAVHGECLEAFMMAKTPGVPFGQTMFNDLLVRLRRLEADRKDLLGGHPYEVLVGAAALLTSDCRVWWSERFPVQGGPK